MSEKKSVDKKHQLRVGIAAKGLKDGLSFEEIVERLVRNGMAESQARSLVVWVREQVDNMTENAKEL